RRLTGEAVDAAYQANRVIVHRRQAASYQTTCNLLKKRDFVGSDLSANAVFQAMNIRRMYWPFADKSAPTEFAARQRYVEDVVAPPTIRYLLRN
ncbi:hypothetical protein, partial [Pseudomonas viridiflava]|uniref:hypothetical protein n=1 Tax=Pseudomonas viridiflava TaxID=33069 RepID=UPI00197D5015